MVQVITPGILEQFVNPTARQSDLKFEPSQEEFCIFMFGRGSFEDFQLKGYDVIGKAVALLERKFELTFVGAAEDEQRRVEKWFLEETKISREQLTVRGFCSYEEMKRMLQEADLVVMPSRTEGFGLVSLESISAGVPVLVSSESGVAKALQDVEGGMSTVVKSHAPEEWANRIRRLSEQKPGSRHSAALQLREQYNLKYSWQGECKKFEKMILHLVKGTQPDVPLSCHLTGNTTTEDVPKAVFTMDGKEVPKSEYLPRPINAEQKKRSKKEVQAVIDAGCSPKPAVHTNGRVQGVQIEIVGTSNKTGEQTFKGSKQERKLSDFKRVWNKKQAK
ncbi:uncharacterized protein LOC111335169 [Stylophora pistillata]|uniref:uncharacterized protein LOC111335169 n=1 Tax=Stylophora pistillata TaxID=50429 RepID=UPI000C04A149|nr:uncharacterized protein LOC111335169 [Stylophora pistillata]